MFQRIKNLQLKHTLDYLRDVRVLGFVGFGVVALLVAMSGLRVIQTNYELQQRISELQQQVEIQQLQNENLSLRNEYFNTEQYLELQARRQFGLAAPGETVLLVPERVALGYTVDALVIEDKTSPQQIIEKPEYQQNLEAWIEFFLRRNISTQ